MSAFDPVAWALVQERIPIMVADGRTDDEIVTELVPTPSMLDFDVLGPTQRRKQVRDYIALVRSVYVPPEVTMTDYARATVPKIVSAYNTRRRNTGKASRTAVARDVVLDRQTMNDWIAKGWMTWPPTPLAESKSRK